MIDHETPNFLHILYHLAILLLVVLAILGSIHLVFWIGLKRHQSRKKEEPTEGLNRQQRREYKVKNKKNREGNSRLRSRSKKTP